MFRECHGLYSINRTQAAPCKSLANVPPPLGRNIQDGNGAPATTDSRQELIKSVCGETFGSGLSEWCLYLYV